MGISHLKGPGQAHLGECERMQRSTDKIRLTAIHVFAPGAACGISFLQGNTGNTQNKKDSECLLRLTQSHNTLLFQSDTVWSASPVIISAILKGSVMPHQNDCIMTMNFSMPN